MHARYSLRAAAAWSLTAALVWSYSTTTSFAESPRTSRSVETCPSDGCNRFGTAISWEADRAAAAQKARREKKLQLVLHLSGNFEKPTFT